MNRHNFFIYKFLRSSLITLVFASIFPVASLARFDSTFGEQAGAARTGKIALSNTESIFTSIATQSLRVRGQNVNYLLVIGDRNKNGRRTNILARFNDNGEPDNSFGSDANTNEVDLPVRFVTVSAVNVLKDRIYVAGTFQTDAGWDFAVAAYTLNGEPDNTFNPDPTINYVTVDIQSNHDSAHAMTFQTIGDENKILLAGSSRDDNDEFDATIVRLNEDGTLDDNFRVGDCVLPGTGFTYRNTPGHDEWQDIIVGQNGDLSGMIIAVGYQTNGGIKKSSFAIYRENNRCPGHYNPSIRFGIIGDGASEAYSVGIQPNNKIVVGGYAEFQVGNQLRKDMLVVRYDANANVDHNPENGFGYLLAGAPAGYITTSMALENTLPANDPRHQLIPLVSDVLSSLTVLENGAIVLAGKVSPGLIQGQTQLALMRLTENGHLDPTFADLGVDLVNIDNNVLPTQIIMDPNLKMVVSGYTQTDMHDNATRRWLLARFTNESDRTDLSITKTAPEQVVRGSNIVYTLTIENQGPFEAPNAVVSDPLSANLQFVSARIIGSPNDDDCELVDVRAQQNVVCFTGRILPPPHENNKIIIEIIVTPDNNIDTVENRAQVESNIVLENNPGNNTSNVVNTNIIADVSDADGDGVPDGNDNCPNAVNPGQRDQNNDGNGDECDDSDGDGTLDSMDNCLNIANPDQADADGNGVGDACEVGLDPDNDGIANPQDNCPINDNPGQEDADNDGQGDVCDADDDNDNINDGNDNCRLIANQGQEDDDGNGIGNACDPNFGAGPGPTGNTGGGGCSLTSNSQSSTLLWFYLVLLGLLMMQRQAFVLRRRK